MKLNKETLKRIIAEELQDFLGEARIRRINPLDNIPDGKNKNKIQNLINQGGNFANQGYEFAYAMQDPSMGPPYEGTDYPGEMAHYDASAAIGKASAYIGKYAEALIPSPNNNSFTYKHVEKIFKGTVEVDFDEGRGPIQMSIKFYFDGESPISLYDMSSGLAFAYLDLNAMQYSQNNINEATSNIEIGLKKMMISEAQKLIFRSKAAAHHFGVKAMHAPLNPQYPSDELGGSGVFRRDATWRVYGKYSPPNEQEIAEKIKNGTIVINN